MNIIYAQYTTKLCIRETFKNTTHTHETRITYSVIIDIYNIIKRHKRAKQKREDKKPK